MFILIFLLSFTSQAKLVDPQNFQVGANWNWTYYEKSQDTWQTYHFEKYTVIARDQDLVTIEMSSRPNENDNFYAHHRVKMKLTDCLNSDLKPFTVQFFSKTFLGAWQLINARHPHLVFTEKFNCSNKESIDPWGSRYSEETGVAVEKFFEPKGDYKFEFLK